MYLDPGLGSMIIQIIIAALATVGAALVFMKDHIRRWFGKKSKQTDKLEITEPENSDTTEESKK